jgi:hypothetical protein
MHLLVDEGRAGAAAPGHAGGGADGEQQVELLREQPFVVLQVVAEQRERLDEGAPPRQHLGAAAGEQVERGEALEDADRVVRAEHGDGGGEADPAGPTGDGGQDHLGRRDDEVGAVVLADAEHVEAHRLGQLRLLHDLAHPLRGAGRDPRARVGAVVAEGEDADLEGGRAGCRGGDVGSGVGIGVMHVHDGTASDASPSSRG